MKKLAVTLMTAAVLMVAALGSANAGLTHELRIEGVFEGTIDVYPEVYIENNRFWQNCLESQACYLYPEGAKVWLFAKDDVGGEFVAWTGCDSTFGAEGRGCFVELTSDKTPHSEFEVLPHPTLPAVIQVDSAQVDDDYNAVYAKAGDATLVGVRDLGFVQAGKAGYGHVAIQNPNQQAILFYAHIEGGPEFRLKDNKFQVVSEVLQPGETYNVEIGFKPNRLRSMDDIRITSSLIVSSYALTGHSLSDRTLGESVVELRGYQEGAHYPIPDQYANVQINPSADAKYYVTNDGRKTYIGVSQGTVTVSNKLFQKKAVTVRAGYYTTLTTKTAPSAPKRSAK